jgi:cell division transport system permease protein
MSAVSTRAYALRRAFAMMGEQPAAFLLSVLLAAAALALPLAMTSLANSVRPLAARVQPGPEISVFVAVSASARETEALRARLSGLPDMVAVRLVPRDAALADLMKRSTLEAPLKDLRANPLPDVLIARLANGVATARIESVASEIRKWPLVDSVRADTDWYRKLGAIARVLARLAVIFGGLVAVLVALILVGTVRLHAAMRADETRILRIVGATPGFIIRPYAYSAGLSLAMAAVIATGIVLAALAAVRGPLAELAQLYGQAFALPPPDPRLVLVFVVGSTIFGLIVGNLGARVALSGIR